MKPRIRFDPRREMWVCGVRLIGGDRYGMPRRDPAEYVDVTAAAAYRGWKMCRAMGLCWEIAGGASMISRAVSPREYPPMMNGREHA